MRKTIVWVTTQFVAFHRWKEAPDNVRFLRDYHRHIFHVQIGMDVSHSNREIEFFQFKEKVDIFLRLTYEMKKLDESCEMIASRLLETFNAVFVEVSEDGENGARVIHLPKKDAE